MGIFKNIFRHGNYDDSDYNSSQQYDGDNDENEEDEYAAKCDRCDRWFDEDDANEDFDRTLGMNYFDSGCFSQTLCRSCMEEVIEDPDPGDYTGVCCKCNYTFDLCDAMSNFSSRVDDNLELTDMWDNGALCADCAVEEYESMEDPFGDVD